MHTFSLLTHECSCIACPIRGQIRLECAANPSCHRTCNGTVAEICSQDCIPNGCQCPAGTVIDQIQNECVPPFECECSGTPYNVINV